MFNLFLFSNVASLLVSITLGVTSRRVRESSSLMNLIRKLAFAVDLASSSLEATLRTHSLL